MVTETVVMGRSSTTSGEPEKRKPFKPARIKMALAELAETRAEQLAQDFTQYVNDALRMRLEQEGMWPPPPVKPKSRS